jgi:hypothetical protein
VTVSPMMKVAQRSVFMNISPVWDYDRREYVRLQIEAGVSHLTDSAKLGLARRPVR